MPGMVDAGREGDTAWTPSRRASAIRGAMLLAFVQSVTDAIEFVQPVHCHRIALSPYFRPNA
jgi:hypothetical protein